MCVIGGMIRVTGVSTDVSYGVSMGVSYGVSMGVSYGIYMGVSCGLYGDVIGFYGCVIGEGGFYGSLCVVCHTCVAKKTDVITASSTNISNRSSLK